MLFLVALFLIKNTSIFKNTVNFVRGNQGGLVYSTAKIGDLVNKDTDGDGVLDWEEPLYGLDPTKKETVPGTPDSTAISKLKVEQEIGLGTMEGSDGQNTENLTKTDQFSRELFSTVSALNQSGAMNQATAEQLSNSLAAKIQDTVPRKVFVLSDIKTIKDNSAKAIKNYQNNIDNIQKKYPDNGYVLDILRRFVVDENSVDADVLVELDPIIKQSQNMLAEILKISVPQPLASIHLDLLNAGERLIENISDMRLFDTDPIVAMEAMTKYEDNVLSLQSALNTLTNTIDKLSN